MTKFDYIKSLSREELAAYLCSFFDAVDCEKCPAAGYCYYGHNGMPDWLDTEAENGAE